MLYTLGQLSNEFPEVTDFLNSRLEEAELKIPTKPPTRGNNPITTTTVSNDLDATADPKTTSTKKPLNNNQPLSNKNSSIVVQPTTFDFDF